MAPKDFHGLHALFFFFFSYVAVATFGFGRGGFCVCFKRYALVKRFKTSNINRIGQGVVITREDKKMVWCQKFRTLCTGGRYNQGR